MTDKEIKAACEAVLFACGESVNAKRIAQALELDEKKVEPQLEALVNDYKIRPEKPKYYFNGDHLDSFLYSPTDCKRCIETVFT